MRMRGAVGAARGLAASLMSETNCVAIPEKEKLLTVTSPPQPPAVNLAGNRVGNAVLAPAAVTACSNCSDPCSVSKLNCAFTCPGVVATEVIVTDGSPMTSAIVLATAVEMRRSCRPLVSAAMEEPPMAMVMVTAVRVVSQVLVSQDVKCDCHPSGVASSESPAVTHALPSAHCELPLWYAKAVHPAVLSHSRAQRTSDMDRTGVRGAPSAKARWV
mmetsp:Transcript_84659/g.193039  ORF Transcript_84659/g.193039 Transcript_84659/m.193039 type:complete len:216 (+) Transcript_84659:695-1342(+)